MNRWDCRDCHARYGAWLSRCPRCGSAKELVVALNVCTGCTTKFAVGLPRCPHCRSTDFQEDGDPMAKITRHGGASDDEVPAPEEEAEAVGAPAPEPDVEEEPAAEPLDVTEFVAGPAEPVEVRGEHGPELVEQEGGDGSSPGSSSSASTETPQPNSEPSEPPPLSRAPTTGSRSRKGRTGSRSASSTDGGPAADTSAADK